MLAREKWSVETERSGETDRWYMFSRFNAYNTRTNSSATKGLSHIASITPIPPTALRTFPCGGDRYTRM